MVDTGQVLRSFLLTDPTLTALVGSRIYYGADLPAGYTPADGPAILFNTRGGSVAYHNQTLQPSCQYRCFASEAPTAWLVDRALYGALHDRAGLKVRQSRLETPGQLIPNELDWFVIWSTYRHWLVNE